MLGRRLSLTLVLALTFSGCVHTPPTITTPQGHAAFTADQIVVRVNELEKTAISAEATGGLPTPTARIIVTFAVSADKTLAQLPAGWQAALAAAWAQAKVQIGTPQNLSIVAAMGAVDVAITSLSGGAQ